MKLTKEEWKIYKKRNLYTVFNEFYSVAELFNTPSYKILKKENWLKKQYCKLLKLKFKLDFLISGKASFGFIDFMITTKCSLKCEQCCSLMPFYNNNTHYTDTFESFKENLDNLLNSVDKIYKLQLIGGEPLLNKELAKMIDYASRKKQIKHIITVTNGTILPDDNIIKAYQRNLKKNCVIVSDYRDNNNIKILKTEQVLSKFKSAGINTHIVDYPWTKRGDIKKSNRSARELEDTMFSCWQHRCNIYCDGEIHLCSRALGITRNIAPELKDYVKVSSKDCSEEIVKFFCKPYIQACDYCHTEMNVKIPRGVQIVNEGVLHE